MIDEPWLPLIVFKKPAKFATKRPSNQVVFRPISCESTVSGSKVSDQDRGSVPGGHGGGAGLKSVHVGAGCEPRILNPPERKPCANR